MTATEFLVDLARRGVRLRVAKGRLQVDAPVGVLTDVDREAMARHKTMLVLLLSDCTADDIGMFLERAAIREFDGGQPRAEAERLAWEETQVDRQEGRPW
jgi:hypothetical protein